jgi:hypothetical protein
MYTDSDGEEGIIVLLVVSLLVFAIIATTPPERRAGENVTVSSSASGDNYAYGVEMLGFGFSLHYIPQGQMWNLYGECTEYSSLNLQLGSFGFSYTESEGNGTIGASISLLSFSVNASDPFDASSWTGGLSFSMSGGAPSIGSGGISYDIDFIGLIKGQFEE